jgi:hypothetical protein
MDFNKTVNIERLTKEITLSSIVTALDNITSAGTSCSIMFKAELSTTDNDTLTNIVSTHIASPLVRIDIQQVSISSSVAPAPFAAKTINGKSLFKRIHGLQMVGVIGVNTFEFIVPYNQCKITGVEIIGASSCDIADLEVYDTPAGTFSGVPNYRLNQFGFNVTVSKDYYEQKSEFDSDLYKFMKVEVHLITQSAGAIGINLILNEVK